MGVFNKMSLTFKILFEKRKEFMLTVDTQEKIKRMCNR